MRWKAETIEEKMDRLTIPIPECGCHAWLGTINPEGYPRMRRIKPQNVARYVFEKANGVIPEGFQIDHTCRSPWCVNPDHLEAVTPEENQRRRKYNIFCKKGHLRIKTEAGGLLCLECRRKTARDYWHNHREERLLYSRHYDRTKRERGA